MLTRIAGINIDIQDISREAAESLEPYRAEGNATFSVRLLPGEIDAMRIAADEYNIRRGRPDIHYSDLQLEMNVIRKKIMEKSPLYGVIGMHASAVAVDGQTYIFTARSGVGKSTHTRLWREMMGERAIMVNDDKPMLRITDEMTLACGNPWNGKHEIGNNIQVPANAICFLERSADNWIYEISRREALPVLLSQTYRPKDPAAMSKTMELIMKSKVKFYRLGCNMDPEAARVAYEGMRPH